MPQAGGCRNAAGSGDGATHLTGMPEDPLEPLLPALSRDLLAVPVPWATCRASTPLSPSGRGRAGREPLSPGWPIAGDKPGRAGGRPPPP